MKDDNMVAVEFKKDGKTVKPEEFESLDIDPEDAAFFKSLQDIISEKAGELTCSEHDGEAGISIFIFNNKQYSTGINACCMEYVEALNAAVADLPRPGPQPVIPEEPAPERGSRKIAVEFRYQNKPIELDGLPPDIFTEENKIFFQDLKGKVMEAAEKIICPEHDQDLTLSLYVFEKNDWSVMMNTCCMDLMERLNAAFFAIYESG